MFRKFVYPQREVIEDYQQTDMKIYDSLALVNTKQLTERLNHFHVKQNHSVRLQILQDCLNLINCHVILLLFYCCWTK